MNSISWIESEIYVHETLRAIIDIIVLGKIGVASTKAFIGQLLVLYILTIKISEVRKEISILDYEKKINDLKKLPD